MLSRLHIENVALIDKLDIDFFDGLNILTGETGAGKSIVIDSITALIGGRISRNLIRTGCDKAVIEGLFSVSNQLGEYLENVLQISVEEDNTILIVREIYQNGKNICKINGRMATVSQLKQIGENLVDIHGQQDNQSLLIVNKHIEFLDNYIGGGILPLKKGYSEKLLQLKALRANLQALETSPDERERRIDLLKYQTNEIGSANLKHGEEEALTEKKLVQVNSEKLIKALSNSYELLSGNGTVSIDSAVREMSVISFIDTKFSRCADSLRDISYNIEEIVREIRSWRDESEFQPEMLDHIEERLDIIATLKRKYGKDIDEILRYNDKIKLELDEILNSSEKIQKLKIEIEAVNLELFGIALQLGKLRKDNAILLSKKIVSELASLEMKNTRFEVIQKLNEQKDSSGTYFFNENGLDEIEFYISPNPGEEPKPLSKIASGGEMSRIMLAIKTILAKTDSIPTLIFDEIDTGISGRTAGSVAEKLAGLSHSHQVLCVTHSAQIAAMADHHYVIEKIHTDGRTKTRTIRAGEEDRVKAVASIMGNTKISEITINHAQEMISNAQKIKNALRN